MASILVKGDVVAWLPVPVEELKFGELVVFPRKNRMVVHRYLGARRSKGDTVPWIDLDRLDAVPHVGRVHSITRGKRALKVPRANGVRDRVAAVISLLGWRVARIFGRHSHHVFSAMLRGLYLGV